MKKFIALILAFCLFVSSVNLMAKERRGADLVITKKAGQHVRGELITVKENSLLLEVTAPALRPGRAHEFTKIIS